MVRNNAGYREGLYNSYNKVSPGQSNYPPQAYSAPPPSQSRGNSSSGTDPNASYVRQPRPESLPPPKAASLQPPPAHGGGSYKSSAPPPPPVPDHHLPSPFHPRISTPRSAPGAIFGSTVHNDSDQPLDLGAPTKRKLQTESCHGDQKALKVEPNGSGTLYKVSEPSVLTTAPPSEITTVKNVALDNIKKEEVKEEPEEKDNTKYVHKLKKAWIKNYVSEPSSAQASPSNSNPCTPPPPPPPSSSVRATPSPALSSASSGKGRRKRKSNANSVNGHSDKKPESSSLDSDEDEDDDEDKANGKKKGRKQKNQKTKPIRTVRILRKKYKSHDLSHSEEEEDEEDEEEIVNHEGEDSKDSTDSTQSKKKGRKRGRKPKRRREDEDEDDDDEFESKMMSNKQEMNGKTNGHFERPPTSQLKRTGESFLQDNSCFEGAPKLSKCRECRWTQSQRNKKMPNIFCRFYAFRRLRYAKNCQLTVAGFSDPKGEATKEELDVWRPKTISDEEDDDDEDSNDEEKEMSLKESLEIMSRLKKDFETIMRQEREVVEVHAGEGKDLIQY